MLLGSPIHHPSGTPSRPPAHPIRDDPPSNKPHITQTKHNRLPPSGVRIFPHHLPELCRKDGSSHRHTLIPVSSANKQGTRVRRCALPSSKPHLRPLQRRLDLNFKNLFFVLYLPVRRLGRHGSIAAAIPAVAILTSGDRQIRIGAASPG